MAVHVTVMKFGGTSLEDGPAFRRVAQIVGNCRDDHPVVIASAMSGMTSALLNSLATAAGGEINGALRSLEEHFERYLLVADGLGKTAETRAQILVESAQREISEILCLAASNGATPQLSDAIASHGERLSANLLTIVLEVLGLPAAYVNAHRCIVTNEEYGEAKPLIQETRRRTRAQLEPLIAKRKIPVLEGFVAATRSGVPTTLGRGSSNYTATLVSAVLGACETQIWTDVNGVLTGDPCLVTKPRTIPTLSYGEAFELARLGIRVLHPKMIQPARERVIPVRICNSRAPQERGTLIHASTEPSPGGIKAIAHKTSLVRINVWSTPTFVADGFSRAIKKIFSRHRTELDIVGRSEVSISLVCKETAPLDAIARYLQQIGSIEIETNCAIISCVGEGLEGSSRARETIQRLREIDPLLAWHATSSVNLTTVIDSASVASVIRRLHGRLFESDHHT